MTNALGSVLSMQKESMVNFLTKVSVSSKNDSSHTFTGRHVSKGSKLFWSRHNASCAGSKNVRHVKDSARRF